jgi:hypothetical protein
MNHAIPNTPNLSLVAFYGNKSPELTSLIRELQNCITDLVGEKFVSYQLEQVHATLLGLEGRRNSQGILNKWYWYHREETKYMDFKNLLFYLRYSGRLPIIVRIGGYDRTVDYGFLSRDRHPYERSFNIQGNIAVLMGWPCRERHFSMELDRLRLEGQNFNILHKYFKSVDTVDNDLYMRLGMFKNELSTSEIVTIEEQVQRLVHSHLSLYLSVDINSVFFTYYQDEFLTPETTRVIPLTEATPEQLESIYPLL